MPVMVPHATLVEFVSVLAALRSLGDALALEFEDFRLDRAGNRMSNLILQVKQIGEVAIVPFRHYVMVGIGSDQLHRNPDPMAGLAHAALNDIAHPQFLADLFDSDGLALVI